MFKRTLLALALAAGSALPAQTQNTTCSDRPAGDSSNACANTRFVGTAISGYVQGPGSSVVGNIAYWNNTSGNLLGATPTYQAGNPANSSLYSIVTVPPAAFTGVYNAMQVSQGAVFPAAQQYGVTPLMQSIVGTSVIAAGDTTTFGSNGIAGYSRSDSSPTAGNGRNAVGVLGWAYIGAANGNAFGGNMGATNNTGSCVSACADGFDVNYISGLEVNLNLWQKAGPTDPTIAGGHAYGITIAGSGNLAAAVSGSAGIVINKFSIGSSLAWNHGVQTLDGAATNALSVGQLLAGSSQPSQKVLFNSTNAGGTPKQAYINTDLNGTVQIVPALATILFDGSVAASIIVQSGLGTAGVQLTKLATAGIVTNAAGGNLSSSAVGTGVLTALGVNVGSAGSFVVFDGALGTPSSGTLTNATGLPISTGVSGLGAGCATWLGTPSSANLRTCLTDETGTGLAYFQGGALGTPSSGTVTNLTGTASININGTVGATTPSTGSFTTLAASSTVTFASAAVIVDLFENDASNQHWYLIADGSQFDFRPTSLGTTSAFTLGTALVTFNLPFSMTDTTDATSSTTGSVKTAGGLGVAKAAWFGTYINVGTKLRSAGSAPALSSCGTTPTIEGSDLSGTVTMGTGSPTGCVITFNVAYTNAPRCSVTWRTNIASMQYTVSTSAITLTQTATSSNLIDYICTVRSAG